jgi:cellulase
MRYSTLSLIAALSQHATAHGIVTKIIVAGASATSTYQGYDPNFQYMPTPPPTIGWAAPATQDRGPVQGDAYQNADIICQRNATNAKTSAKVNAGDVISLQWTVWPQSHKGPMLDYLADCGGDCSTVDKSTLKFFKIDGVGMTSTTGVSRSVSYNKERKK